VERVYQAVDTNFAGLDILVACAALGAQPIHEMSDRDWHYVIETGSTGSDMRECAPPEQRDLIGQHRVLRAEQVTEAILFVLSREDNCDIVWLRIEPRLQKDG
jgi:NADP-dependent 3-hydroxy acid dehydrogenase YdfG